MIGLNKNLSCSYEALSNKINSLENETKRGTDTVLPFINNLSELTTMVKTTTHKGKIGESTIYTQIVQNIQNIYPTWKITNVANVANESDINIDTGKYRFLVESKFYKNTVPTSQIEKLYKDIECTSANGAILVSLTSSIMGKSLFEIEYYKNSKNNSECIIIYVPNSELSTLLTSILLMNCLLENSVVNTTSKYSIDSIMVNIGSHLNELDIILNDIQIIRSKVIQTKSDINTLFDTLYKDIYSMEIKMGMTMANISKYFDNSKETFIDTNESEVLAFIEKRDEYKIVYDIVNSIPTTDALKLNLKDGELVIVSKKDNKLIAKTHSIKKRVDLHTVIKNEIGSEMKMIYGVETNSNNSIVITVNTDNIVHIKNRLISCN